MAESRLRAIRDASGPVLAVALGALTSLVIVAFMWTTERVSAQLSTAQSRPWTRVAVPIVGSLLAGYLVWRFFPQARGSGIPQTKAAVASPDAATFN